MEPLNKESSQVEIRDKVNEIVKWINAMRTHNFYAAAYNRKKSKWSDQYGLL